jgi:hypothetical protein
VRLPSDWEARKAPGWWSLHYLKHTPCGWETGQAYDLWLDSGPFGESDARRVVYGHRCEGDTDE